MALDVRDIVHLQTEDLAEILRSEVITYAFVGFAERTAGDVGVASGGSEEFGCRGEVGVVEGAVEEVVHGRFGGEKEVWEACGIEARGGEGREKDLVG